MGQVDRKPSKTLGRTALAVIALAGAGALFVKQASTKPEEYESDERSLQILLDRYEQWGFSGSALVTQGDKVLIHDGWGMANRGTGESATADTRYDFASVAKTFTGAATLALSQRGLLNVDNPLEAYLGPLPAEKSAATVFELATHRAGLAHRSRSQIVYDSGRVVFVESMKNAPIEAPPGTEYRYTNAGFSLLAALVETVADEPFEDFVESTFLQPLGLTATGFIMDHERGEPGLALGYRDESSEPAPADYEYGRRWGLLGSTGMISNVSDIHDWFRAVWDGSALPGLSRSDFFIEAEEEAFGWHVDTDDAGRARIHKGGGLSAMQTQVIFYPDEDILIVWAHNNMTQNWRSALNAGISAVALGDDFEFPPEQISRSSTDAPQSGWYGTEDGTLLKLIAVDGQVSVGGNGFGLREGLLAPIAGGWAAFDPRETSTAAVLPGVDDNGVQLEIGTSSYSLARANAQDPADLIEPGATALAAARQAIDRLMVGDAEALWRMSLFRPILGGASRDGWMERFQFIEGRLGTEARLIEEAWALRDGYWRYWRTFESANGVEVLIRLQVTPDGKVAGYSINPAAAAPQPEEKQVLN